MKINVHKCEFLNYYYNNRQIKNKKEIKCQNDLNKYQKYKIKNLFSKFSDNEVDKLKNYLNEIIKNESKNTLNYNNLGNESISEFEKKRNVILKLLILHFEKKYDNFNDLYIFQIINIIDRYIYANFNDLNEDKIIIIIHACFKLISKFDKYLFNFDNDKIKKTELDIMLKLNFDLYFLTSYEIKIIIYSMMLR